jgi:hypothetical protein
VSVARLRRPDGPTLLLVAALGHVGIFAGLFRSVYSIPYSGTGLFYTYAGKVLSGLLPYRDFLLEYPPFALVFFTLPRVLGESFRWYYVWYQTQVVLFDLVAVVALYLAARRWSLPAFDTLLAYSIAVLAVGPITLHQFDIFPAVFTVLALLAFAAKRDATAGAMLALGVMTKIYPILLAPVFVLARWREQRWRAIGAAVASFVAVSIACLLPWLVTAPGSLRVLIAYHTERGIHLDSTWATVAFIARAFGLTWVDVRMSFASWNIDGPVPRLLVPVSTIILVATLVGCYAWVWGQIARDVRRVHDLGFLARASALVLIASMAASKVFSPQYLFWPVPLLVLVEPWRLRVPLALFVIAGLLTYWLYPWNYGGLLAERTPEIVMCGVRNAVVAATAVALARGPRSAEATPAGIVVAA